MKDLINKITNKDRLVKLYGCSECSTSGFDTHNLTLCPRCNSKGYTINRDSQVLDIVDYLIKTRDTVNIKSIGFDANFNKYPAHALIKLIELTYISDEEYLTKSFNYIKHRSFIDTQMRDLIFLIVEGEYGKGFNNLLYFSNHHKIDIWASVAEILEGEE